MANSASAISGDLAATFRETLGEIAELLSPDVVDSFTIRKLQPHWRDILLHGLRGQDWHTSYAVTDKYDRTKRMVRVLYRYIGEPPEESVYSRGELKAPRYAKTRAIEFFGDTLMWERVLWVDARGTLELRLDGSRVELLGGLEGRAHASPRRPRHRQPLPSSGSPSSRGHRPASRSTRCACSRPARRCASSSTAPGCSWTASTTPTTPVRSSSAGCATTVSRRQRVVRPREGHPGLEAAQGRGLRLASRRARHAALEAAHDQRRAPHLLAHRRARAEAAGHPQAHRPALEVHLPPARRHQGRPVALAQPQADGHLRHVDAGGVRVDRGRRLALRLHGQGGGPDRAAALRPAARQGAAHPG